MMRMLRHTAMVALVLGLALRAALAAESLAVREERAIKAAVARVAPSVVRIETVGGLDRVGELLIGTGPTTGLIVAADGYIVSSAFNFIQKPESILVTLPDGSRRAASLVATDHSRMLVLLKVESDTELPVPEVVPASEMRPGAWALAVGRAFEADRPNVSVGIISAVDRIWGKAIQTDAKISPNNYGGPLVDIAGRVLGVLVPMSPDNTEDVAGVEWYDSGIGFAIPLEDVERALPKLREGHDLHPGLLGISIKGTDLYAQPAVIAAVRGTAPAYKAGLRAGDTVVEVAGEPITCPAELKQQLGRFYAGDRISVVAVRDQRRLEREIELVQQIEPYEFPFLGILPMRYATEHKPEGLPVRYVYPGSPAAIAGIEPGDVIQSFAGEKVAGAETVAQKLAEMVPLDTVKIEVQRGEQVLVVEPRLSTLPESLPAELPAAHAALELAEGERPEVGTVAVKTPEFNNECLAYVPTGYDPRLAYGVVVWLHAPGGYKPDELVERWKGLCDRYDFILLAPRSSDKAGWQPTEARFVRRVLDELRKKYNTDPARIVVHGHEGGGAMAYVAGLGNRELFRAVAAVDAPLPRLVQPPETDPVQRFAFYTTLATKSEIAPAVESTISRLRALKYPVTVQEVGEQGRYLTAEELEQLVRWFDSLDRL